MKNEKESVQEYQESETDQRPAKTKRFPAFGHVENFTTKHAKHSVNNTCYHLSTAYLRLI